MSVVENYLNALKTLNKQSFDSNQKRLIACKNFIDTYQFDASIQKAIFNQIEGNFLIQKEKNRKKFKKDCFILLAQYIDFRWYQSFPNYKNESDLKNDSKLNTLKQIKKTHVILFNYIVLNEGFLFRYYNSFRKRVHYIFKKPTAHTIGMRTTYCKLEIIALLNEINKEISIDYGNVIKLQINSIIRTKEHQEHLVKLGYSAASMSSHSCGYAIDIERSWYLLNNKELFLSIQKVIDHYQKKEIIHLIDEGNIWHICLNPNYIEYYQMEISLWTKSL